MKILHINSGQDGGAALCAIRLNKSLEKQGIESRMLFAEGDSLPEGVDGAIAEKDLILWKRNYFFKIMRYLKNRLPWGCDFWKNRYELRKAFKYLNPAPYVHQPCSCYTNIAHHPLVEWADIVHLHWVPEFVDYPTFFKEVRKPIVWTLHDKFPAVGLEHYCLGYSNLPKELEALDKKCVEIKRKGVSKANNLSIVAISYQMADICSKSEVLKDCPCTVIHNGVDTSVFKPISIVELSFNIPSSAIVFMFSSYWIWDENKGLNRVIEALERINCDNKFLIVVGVDDGKKPYASFPVFCTGRLTDQTMLACLYSRANFFILASFEETFAQTPLEAMACGTPVISTPCGGIDDLICPSNGVICKSFESSSISAGIEQALSREYSRDEIRQHIIEEFDYNIISKEYKKLYESVL